MIVSLPEVKQYLRIDYDDEDDLLLGLIDAAEELCAGIARVPFSELPIHDSNYLRVAILYAIAYMHEHREEADHHELTLTLRSLLFGMREAAF